MLERIITRPSLPLLMLTLKREASEDLALLASTVSAVEELENWTRLVFDDMDRESLSNNRKPRRSRAHSTDNDTTTNTTGQQSMAIDTTGVSEYTAFNICVVTSEASIPSDIQDAALLAQFAAAAGNANMGQDYSNVLSQNTYPSMGPTPGFYGNFMHHNSMPPPQLPPLSSLDFPWHSILPHQSQSGMSQYDSRHASSSVPMDSLPFIDAQYNPTQPAAASRGGNRRAPQEQGSSTQRRASSSPEVEQISDEKRRRNTAASGETRGRCSLDYRITNRFIHFSAFPNQEEAQDHHPGTISVGVDWQSG